jgi:hypothetical protein
MTEFFKYFFPILALMIGVWLLWRPYYGKKNTKRQKPITKAEAVLAGLVGGSPGWSLIQQEAESCGVFIVWDTTGPIVFIRPDVEEVGLNDALAFLCSMGLGQVTDFGRVASSISTSEFLQERNHILFEERNDQLRLIFFPKNGVAAYPSSDFRWNSNLWWMSAVPLREG